MSYLISRTDGTLLTVLLDSTFDSKSTPLTLVGRDTYEYGAAIDENFVSLLENFANDVSPTYALKGQLWFDSSNNNINFFNGIEWHPLASVGGFGDTTDVLPGLTLAGAQSGANRVAGVTGYTVASGDKSTSIAVIFSEGKIISVVSGEYIAQNLLPAYLTIRDLSFDFQSRFANGIVAGFNLASGDTTYVYSGLGTGLADTIAGLAAETSTRVLQVDDLIQVLTTLSVALTASQASITTEQDLRVNADSALAAQITSVKAQTDANLATVTSEISALTTTTSALSQSMLSLQADVAQNTATITQEAQAQATTNSATASTLTELTASVASAVATITTNQTANATANSALADQLNTLSVSLQTGLAADGTTVLNLAASITAEQTARIADGVATAASITLLNASVNQNAASIANETTVRTDAVSAIATQISTLTATTATNTASITNNATASTNANVAFTSQINALTSTVAGNTSAITTEAQTRSDAISATNSLITSLTSTVAGNTAAISTESQTRATADSAISSTLTTVTASAGRQRVFFQSTAPVGNTDAVWFNTSDGNKPYTWNGTAWVAAQDAGIGLVAAAQSAETTARTTADTAIVTAANSLLATVNANTAAINTNATTAANATSAVATSVTNLSASVTSQIGTVNASIGTEAQTRATNDTAISNTVTALSSTVGTNLALLNTETSTRASADTAITNTATLLAATVASNTAAISTEATTRATADTAISNTVTTVAASANRQRVFIQSTAPVGNIDAVWFNTSDGNKPYMWNGAAWTSAQDSGIAFNAAALSTEVTARTTADTALSSQITSLLATVSGNTAAITANATTAANANSATASSVTSLTATVAGHTTTLTTYGTAISNIGVSYGIVGTLPNGATGGFHLTGIEQANGLGGTFDLVIDANVTIHGKLIVNSSTGTSSTALITGAGGATGNQVATAFGLNFVGASFGTVAGADFFQFSLPGTYAIFAEANISIATNNLSDVNVSVSIYVNGSQVVSNFDSNVNFGGTITPTVSTSWIVIVNAGDYVQVIGTAYAANDYAGSSNNSCSMLIATILN